MNIFMTILLMLTIFPISIQAGFRFSSFETCDPMDQKVLNQEEIVSLRQAFFINDMDPYSVDYHGLQKNIGLEITQLENDKINFSVGLIGKSYEIDFYNQVTSHHQNGQKKVPLKPNLDDSIRIYFLCGHSVSALVLMGPQVGEASGHERVKREEKQLANVYYPRRTPSAIYILFGYTVSVIFSSLAIYIVSRRNAAKDTPNPEWPLQEDSDSDEDARFAGKKNAKSMGPESSLFSTEKA